MQVFFFSTWITIALFVVIWAVVPLLLAYLSHMVPDRFLQHTRYFWRSHPFEQNGRLYETVFKIRLWKHLLPDGGGVFKKNSYKKKTLTDYSEENLQRFLLETCRGELVHWLGILPFWVFGLFAPPGVIWIMLLYALSVNLPCIIAQRYNRPRIYALLKKRYPNS
jgi:glycosyl-4,4'-diaponeurosporenoate acyltransferase